MRLPMKGHMFNQKTLTSLTIFLAVFLLASAAFAAPAAQQQNQQSSSPQQSSQQAQNAPPQSQQASPAQVPPAKSHKVWNNEDVVSLRTPEDIYLVEKEAQEAAAAEAAARETADDKLTNELGLTMTFPATVEETQQWIKVREKQMKEDQATLERLNRELAETSADRRADIQKQTDGVTNDLQQACIEIKLLQNHLQKLTKPSAAESSAAQPSPLSL